MTTTFCTSGQALLKAGKNVYIEFISGGNFYGSTTPIDDLINQAESLINTLTKHDFVAGYEDLSDDRKKILEEVSSNLAAIYLITYDMSGFTSRVEAEDIINVLRDAVLRGLGLLRDTESRDFIRGLTDGS